MNLAHIHLLLNHVPLISLPIVLLFFCYGAYAKNIATQRFALVVLIVTAALVLPVYFTGESAEEIVKQLPENFKGFIHPHEEAAEISLVLTLMAGFVALLSLWFSRSKTLMPTLLNGSVIVMTLVAILSLGYTANLGGQIRHSEIRASSTLTSPGAIDHE